MDVRRLRYFVAVAEELSFTRGAERLRMAQPPLSVQIRKLERELGVELFDRSARRIALTSAGEVLLEQAGQLLVGMEQTEVLVRRAGRGEVGRLTVGFVPSASNDLLPEGVRTFRGRHPQVELYLREMQPDDLVEAVLQEGMDVCFLYLPFEHPELRVRTVSREPLIAALPFDHRLCERRSLTVGDLSGERFVLPARHRMPGLLGQIQDACRDAGFTPEPVQKDVWLMQTVIGLVAAGLGIALVPSSVRNLGRTGVRYRSLDGVARTVELGAVWRPDTGSAVLENFLAVFEERSGARGARGGAGEVAPAGSSPSRTRQSPRGRQPQSHPPQPRPVPVRRAGDEDMATAGRLLHEFNREFGERTPGPKRLADRLRALIGSGETVVLLAGDEPAGIAVLRFREAIWSAGRECYLTELYVAPGRRGRGLGRGLMEAAMREARERGAETMEIGVDEPDLVARQLYESLGFTNRTGGREGPLMYFYEREL